MKVKKICKEVIKYENSKYYLLEGDNILCCAYWIEISEPVFNYLKNLGAFVFGKKEELELNNLKRKLWKI